MPTMARLGLFAALLVSGCSAVINSGQYTGGRDGGVMDTGTGTGDSGVDTGPRDSGASCDPLTSCTGLCTDTDSDPVNCGDCGVVCIPGETCINGTCSTSCIPPSLDCDGTGLCVDTETDSANCGGCGLVCASGETCINGICSTSCIPPSMDCGGLCIDTATDAANCGGCGVPCASGETCVAGACSGTSCPGSQTNCTGLCTDTATDAANCGDCGVPCASGETCSGGVCSPPPSFCECASGQICLGGSGLCVADGTCDSVYPIPGCGGAATVEDLPAFQLGSWPYDTSLRRFDLHITGNVSGTRTLPRPGWTMFWRTEAGVIEAAFASPEYDSLSGGGCYFGGTLGTVDGCATIAGGFNHMDARTLYAGTASTPGGTARPIDAIVTANNLASGSVIELWKLTTGSSSDGRPTNVCLTISDTWNKMDSTGTPLPTVGGLSLAAMGSGVSLFATLGLRTMAKFTLGVPFLSANTDLGRNFGSVAGGYATGLYLGSAKRAVAGWDTVNADTFVLPGGRATAPVAAIDPSSSSEPEIFAFGRDDGRLQTVTCGTSAGGGYRCRSASVFSLPVVADAPVAAYRSGSITTLLALENNGTGNELVRRTNLADDSSVLTDATVGGTITQLVAVDAEGVLLIDPATRIRVGWDYAWAAFVVVDRAGVKSLELWTGAERQCG